MAKASRAHAQIFVGSSSKQRHLAYAIQQNLDDGAEVTCWDQNVFRLTKGNLENLLGQLQRSDFAIFVFAADDIIKIGGKSARAVRDNVVFELGLFMGRLGRSRTFIVAPNGRTNLRIPTDLAGVMIGSFNPHRRDKNIRAALAPFCQAVRERVQKLGRLKIIQRGKGQRRRTRPSADLEIIEATYGARDHHIDVTNKLRSLIDHGRLHVYVGNQLGGDPIKHVRKELVVRFRQGGTARSKRVQERDYLILPAENAG
jgi:hypothetical protein